MAFRYRCASASAGDVTLSRCEMFAQFCMNRSLHQMCYHAACGMRPEIIVATAAGVAHCLCLQGHLQRFQQL
jgi:hypothetical protein